MSDPTLNEIQVQLTKLTGFIEKHVELTENRMQGHEDKLRRHSDEIYGLGDDASPGIKTKVDRLNEKDKVRTIVVGAIGTTTLGLALKAFWSFVTKQP